MKLNQKKVICYRLFYPSESYLNESQYMIQLTDFGAINKCKQINWTVSASKFFIENKNVLFYHICILRNVILFADKNEICWFNSKFN